MPPCPQHADPALKHCSSVAAATGQQQQQQQPGGMPLLLPCDYRPSDGDTTALQHPGCYGRRMCWALWQLGALAEQHPPSGACQARARRPPGRRARRARRGGAAASCPFPLAKCSDFGSMQRSEPGVQLGFCAGSDVRIHSKFDRHRNQTASTFSCLLSVLQGPECNTRRQLWRSGLLKSPLQSSV
eukprot:COSAG01_NODE_6952_length_3421_cov_8.050271_2_plen_186_part_00